MTKAGAKQAPRGDLERGRHPYADAPVNEGAIDATLSRRAYAELRGRLMRGEYGPGQALTLRALAGELQMSVMPVREAVNRLAAEAALTVEPNRLIKVPHLSGGELLDLWAIRIQLEGDAAERAASRGLAAHVAALSAANILVHDAFRAGDPGRMLHHANGYAIEICRASGSALLTGYIENLRLRAAPHIGVAVRDHLSSDTSFYAFSLRLQDELVEAVRSRDGVKAGQLRRVDLQTFRDWVLRRQSDARAASAGLTAA